MNRNERKETTGSIFTVGVIRISQAAHPKPTNCTLNTPWHMKQSDRNQEVRVACRAQSDDRESEARSPEALPLEAKNTSRNQFLTLTEPNHNSHEL